MRRLSSLGSKHLAHRKGRSALTASGIALGVAILFGVLVSNATTQSGVDRLIGDFTGQADVLVSATGAFRGTFGATVPEDRLRQAERLPNVEAAVFSFGFFSSIDTPAIDEPEEITFRGIELESAQRLQPYVVAAGRLFEPGAREIVIPQRLADKLEVRHGRAIKIGTPHGVEEVRLVGILTDTGAGRTDEGDVAFTSLAAAREIARVGPVLSGARVVLSPGTDVESWIDEHDDDLGPGLDFRNAETLAQGFKGFLAVLGAVFTFVAAITLFVGAFLIYLTLSMAVIERTRTYGTMRALGATRGQIGRAVVTEAGTLGIVSTAIGLVLGLAIARGLLVLMSGLFEIDLPGLTITPVAVVAGVAVGLLTTLVSSLVPARRAARLSPVVAMRGDYATETRLGRGWIVGSVAGLLGAGIGLSASGAAAGMAMPLVQLGAVLLTPPLLRPLAAVLGRITRRIARGAGDVAVLHLRKERSRSAYTLALVMVVMATIFSIGGVYTTMKAALGDLIDRQFGSDFHIDSPSPLDEEFAQRLSRVDGVGDLTPVRDALVFVEGRDGEVDEQGFARVIDPATYFDVESFAWVAGTDRDARDALAAGGAILMPEAQAASLGRRVGGEIRVRTSRGVRPFEIAGTFVSFAGPPEIVFGIGDGRRFLNAAGANEYHANIERGATVPEVSERIEAALGKRYNLSIETASVIKQDAQTQFNRFFNIFYAIILVAAIVGLLGLANTLAMSVLQRYREIGILRAIGSTRGQVRRMVLVESSTLGLVAFALSVPLGWLLSVLAVRGISDAFGFDVDYVYPAGWIPIVAAFGIVVAILAAIAPGRRAARLEVVQALQYE